MKVLVVHNRYRYRGGEDIAVDEEIAALRAAGLLAAACIVSNDALDSTPAKIRAAVGAANSQAGTELVKAAIAKHAPDVVHVHNFFPNISPAVHAVARRAGVATVQTFHNFRAICANALLMRDGAPCETCIDRSPYWGAWRACYRGSIIGSIASAHMIAAHRNAGTWRESVDRIIVLSRFARERFVRAGFPAEKLVVKPNSVDDPGPPAEASRSGFVFAGRLSREKGVLVLAEAARLTQATIEIFGEGPLEAEVRASAPANLSVHAPLPRAEVRRRVAAAEAIVVPSLCYEGAPMVISEAMAAGTPIIVSRIGALPELVPEGQAGLQARAGDPADLAAQIDRIAADPAGARSMGRRARALYESDRTPEANLKALQAIYAGALDSRMRGNNGHRQE